MRKSWKWASIILILTALTAWFSIPRISYPEEFQIENFPLYTQPDGVTCGPTSLKMVLEIYGIKHSIEEIRKVALTDYYIMRKWNVGGTTIEYMQDALSHFEVFCKIEKGNINSLKWEVSKGKPIIIMIRSGTANSWHYVVVIGYTKNKLMIADPAYGTKKEYDIERVEKAWDFSHDLYNGKTTTIPCPTCGGDGWLGIFPCITCAGVGDLPDMWHVLMELGEQSTNLMLVPEQVIDK